MKLSGSKKLFLVFAAAAGISLGAYGIVYANSHQALGKTGRLCKNDNSFTYMIRRNGSMDFGLSVWFDSGANCGIIGRAKRTDSGWRYEAPRNNKNQDPPGCTVNIKIEGGHVIFATDPIDDCREECGAQAYLQDFRLPLESSEDVKITNDDLSPEKVFNTPCIEND